MKRLSYRDFGLLVALVVTAAAYFPINRLTDSGANLANGLDGHLPFVPAFALPYVLFIPLFWLTVLYAWLSGRGFKQLVLTAAIVYGLSDVIYLVLHTQVARPEHLGGGFFNDLVRHVYANDRPFCDLPSEHNASAVIFVLYWSKLVANKPWRLLIGLFGLAVIASTVLIDQHTILGAAAGFALAWGAWWFVQKRLAKPTIA